MSRRMTKPTKWFVLPAMSQISLGFRPVWSVFAVRLKKHWVFSYPLSAQRRLWSDLADAKTDLSLCWAHRSFCWFCRAQAHMSWINTYFVYIMFGYSRKKGFVFTQESNFNLKLRSRKEVFQNHLQASVRNLWNDSLSVKGHVCRLIDLPDWGFQNIAFPKNS